MYNRHPCVTDDSYQLSHEHLRQLDCGGHFQSSTEVSPFIVVSSKHQMSDGGEKQCCYSKAEVEASHICLVPKDMESKKRTTDESYLFTEVVVNKRARQENQAVKKLERFDENSSVNILTERKLSEEDDADLTRPTSGVSRRHVPVGPDYQADLPKWSMKSCNKPSADTCWLGTCVMPMPPDSDSIATDAESCYSSSNISCDCTADEGGSIRCVRNHVKAAREKLSRALGKEKFTQMGFSEMGEIAVARRWTQVEEIMFNEIVFAFPASKGRNFWAVLPMYVSPPHSFKELVSYYFNVFILRKRAHQNRLDCVNVDSDNDNEEDEVFSAVVSSPEEGDSCHGFHGIIALTAADRHGDSKPWKTNLVVETKKDIDFEVFGKGSPEKVARNASGFS